jgi:small subunit ribosomal protein S9
MADQKNNYFYALGRRKNATARVRLQGGKGNLTVNGKPAEEYFAGSQSLMTDMLRPFAVLGIENKFDIIVTVGGGGHAGQVGAIRLGVSKALALMNEDLKGTLRKAELLGRDSREKERKKFGLKGARKQRQFTKR